MTRSSIPLVERLSHGLASAVLSAAALAAPSTEAASPVELWLAQSQGGARPPAARTQVNRPTKAQGAQPSSATKPKPHVETKGSVSVGGCGASEGGCGPSR